MRRVYLIWAFRLILRSALWRFAGAFGLVWWLTFHVSFSQVWLNVPKHAWRGPAYTFSAFWGTEHITQLLCLGFLALASWLFFDSLRFFSAFYRRVFA